LRPEISSPVRALDDRLGRRLAVDHHDAGAERAAPLDHAGDVHRPALGDLRPGDHLHRHDGVQVLCHLDEQRHHVVRQGRIHVVGESEDAVAAHLGHAGEFRGDQLAVGEQRMRVQIDHVASA